MGGSYCCAKRLSMPTASIRSRGMRKAIDTSWAAPAVRDRFLAELDAYADGVVTP